VELYFDINERKKLNPTPTIEIGCEVFNASSSRFAVFGFGRNVSSAKLKDEDVKATIV
jgi:hypothetical protein